MKKAKQPNLVSRALLSAANGIETMWRSLTSDSTIAQLGGGSGWGGFGAAKITRLQNDWPSPSRSADQDLIVDLRRLRSRARYQAINSPIAAKFLAMARNNVIGPDGIKLTFKVPRQRKTKGGALDDAANAELKRAWEDWGRKGSCTVCGRYSFKQLQRLMIENKARDGENLLRKVYVPRSVNPYGFQLQLIDADQLDDSFTQMTRADGVQIRMGVEVDSNQKPLAYHLFKGNPYEVTFGSAQRVRVPADQIIHDFMAHRTGQTRGYPWGAASMAQLNMLDGYFSAELAAARISSALIMSIEGADDTDEAIDGDGTNVDGSKAIDIGAGSAIDLSGTGAHLNDHTPAHPTNAFGPFTEGAGRLVASGLNVPYHSLFNNLSGVNMSSARIGEMEARDYWKEQQAEFIDNNLEPIYNAWLRSALLNGAVNLPLEPEKYMGATLKWEPRRWGWFDPLKDIQACTLEIQNGLSTHEKILNANGLDLYEVYQQLSVEQDLADELGLALGTDIRGQGTSEINNEDETAEDGTTDGDAKPKETDDATQPQGTGKPAKPKVRPTQAPGKAKVKP
jgi:lambda family phage portal protein